MLFGAFFQNMLSQGDAQYGSAAKVMNMSSLARVGLSHDADIFKRVMVEYFEMPHVTQIARATLLPGQVASENKHRDMVEYFLFLSGNGIIRLDQRNHTIVRDSFVVVYPPMKHTIFNTGRVPIELLVVASVP